MQTIMKLKESTDIFETPNSSLMPNSSKLRIEIQGQIPERTYEDRDVFISINNDIIAWLQAEDAIKLGQMLIKHGAFAFEANMINHQRIHMKTRLADLVKSGVVKAINFTVINEHPANYGKGFRTYNVVPEWAEGCEPKYEQDFNFNVVIYWSPFEDEFKAQIDRWKNGMPNLQINIHGYDRETELKNFNLNMKKNNQ